MAGIRKVLRRGGKPRGQTAEGFEAAVAAAPRAHLAGGQCEYGQPGPLSEAKGLEQLFAGVFERGTDDIDRRFGQGKLRAECLAAEPARYCEGTIGSTGLFTAGAHHTGLDVGSGSKRKCSHSYRNASTGSSFEARSAGTIPLATPTSNRTPVESRTVITEIFR